MNISIILPVYNVEDYLERAIDSIVKQTLLPYELIIINDGSTDQSAKIIAKYQQRFPWIQVIEQENKGLGLARQAGLERVSGEYLYMMDSDDYLAHDFLEKQQELLKSSKPDIVWLGYYEVQQSHQGLRIKKRLPLVEGVMAPQTYLNQLDIIKDVGFRMVWNKLYRTAFIKQHDIQSPNNRQGQDAIFNHRILSKNPMIHFSQQAYYYYDTTRLGSNVNRYNEQRLTNELAVFQSYLDVIELIEDRSLRRRLYLKELRLFFYIALKNVNAPNSPLSKEARIAYLEQLANHPIFEPLFDKQWIEERNPFLKLIYYLIQWRQFGLANQLYRYYLIHKKKVKQVNT